MSKPKPKLEYYQVRRVGGAFAVFNQDNKQVTLENVLQITLHQLNQLIKKQLELQ